MPLFKVALHSIAHRFQFNLCLHRLQHSWEESHTASKAHRNSVLHPAARKLRCSSWRGVSGEAIDPAAEGGMQEMEGRD